MDDSSRLIAWFSDKAGCVVAFSGGVDSAVLAKGAVLALGDKALALFAFSHSTKANEQESVRLLAGEIGIRLECLASEEFDDPLYIRNDMERCFHCKRIRMAHLLRRAREQGIDLVVEGSNSDDLSDFRPGKRAIESLGIASPLAELGLDKTRIRALARSWGLSVHDKPSEPCLSTRIDYGLALTPQRLRRIDEAESFLATLGFSPLRVRLHPGDLARIEVAESQMESLFSLRSRIVPRLKELGFRFVSMNLEAFRSGNMNPENAG